MAAGDSRLGDNYSTGEVVGTGSAFDVRAGFKPRSVKIHNRTRNAKGDWTAVMPDASAQLIVDSGAGTTDISFITSNGITPVFNGFTLGSNANLNTASDVIYWEAWK